MVTFCPCWGVATDSLWRVIFLYRIKCLIETIFDTYQMATANALHVSTFCKILFQIFQLVILFPFE